MSTHEPTIEITQADLAEPPAVEAISLRDGLGDGRAEVAANLGQQTTDELETVHRVKVRVIEPALGTEAGFSVFGFAYDKLESCFGFVSVIVVLSALAVFPVLQFFTLGYLLAVSAAVSRKGRLRDGLLLLKPAARLGSAIVATWLFVLPLRILSVFYYNSLIINPGSSRTMTLEVVLKVATFLVLFHVILAVLAGARLRNFIWLPGNIISLWRRIAAGRFFATLRDDFWRSCEQLKSLEYFWLGLRGFVGSLIWLAIPTTMLAAAGKRPGIAILGVLTLAWVATVLPFLQINFARENNFKALFNVREARNVFSRAPFAAIFATAVVLLLPIPLYLLKIELIASEAGWLPNLVFIAFILPAKFVAGWAYYRSTLREEPRHWLIRFFSKPLLLPLALAYTGFVFASQFTAWEGVASLYSQHAFLLPVPFGEFGNF